MSYTVEKYRITADIKAETDIIISITVCIELAAILMVMYVKTLKSTLPFYTTIIM